MATGNPPRIDPEDIPGMFQSLSEFVLTGGFGRSQPPSGRTDFERWNAQRSPGRSVAEMEKYGDLRPPPPTTRPNRRLPVNEEALAIEFLKANPEYLALGQDAPSVWKGSNPGPSTALMNLMAAEDIDEDNFWAIVDDLKGVALERGGTTRIAPRRAPRYIPTPTDAELEQLRADAAAELEQYGDLRPPPPPPPPLIGGPMGAPPPPNFPQVPLRAVEALDPLTTYPVTPWEEEKAGWVDPFEPPRIPVVPGGVPPLSGGTLSTGPSTAPPRVGPSTFTPSMVGIDEASLRATYLDGKINLDQAVDALVELWITDNYGPTWVAENYDPEFGYLKDAGVIQTATEEFKKKVAKWGDPSEDEGPVTGIPSPGDWAQHRKDLVPEIQSPTEYGDIVVSHDDPYDPSQSPGLGEYKAKGYFIDDEPNLKVQWDDLSRRFFKGRDRVYSKGIKKVTDRNFVKAYGGFQLQSWAAPDEDLPDHLRNFTRYVEKGYDEPGEKFYDNERIREALSLQLGSSRMAYHPRLDTQGGLERSRLDMAKEINPEVYMLEFLTNGTRSGAIAAAREEYDQDKLVTQPHVGFLYWVKTNKPAIWGSVEREDGSLVALWEKKERQMQRTSQTRPLFESLQQRLAR